MLANIITLERGIAMNENEMAFGKFIEERRKALGLTLRGFASELDIAPAYMSDIEKGRRYPPDKKLNETEKNSMLDLAAMAKTKTVSSDLPEYIMEKDLARVALRRARDGKLSDEGWQEVIDLIDKKIGE